MAVLSDQSQLDSLMEALDRLYKEALFNSQIYFEAAKRISRTSRLLIFVPSIVSSASSVLLLVSGWTIVAVLPAILGVMTATANYLGADGRSAGFVKSGHTFAQLRHRIALTRILATGDTSIEELRIKVEALARAHEEAVFDTQPTSNHDRARASLNIEAGHVS